MVIRTYLIVIRVNWVIKSWILNMEIFIYWIQEHHLKILYLISTYHSILVLYESFISYHLYFLYFILNLYYYHLSFICFYQSFNSFNIIFICSYCQRFNCLNIRFICSYYLRFICLILIVYYLLINLNRPELQMLTIYIYYSKEYFIDYFKLRPLIIKILWYK